MRPINLICPFLLHIWKYTTTWNNLFLFQMCYLISRDSIQPVSEKCQVTITIKVTHSIILIAQAVQPNSLKSLNSNFICHRIMETKCHSVVNFVERVISVIKDWKTTRNHFMKGNCLHVPFVIVRWTKKATSKDICDWFINLNNVPAVCS